MCGVVVFCSALSVYAWTMAPTVTLVDSGELIVAARTLGVAHPPGFPLYILLAHAATLLPIGNIAMRVNLASALFGALAASVITLVVAEILLSGGWEAAGAKGGRRGREKKRGKHSPQTSKAFELSELKSSPWYGLSPALIAGLLFAFSRTLWSYSTVAEVYSLNAFLLGLIILLLLRWRTGALRKESNSDRLLYASALVFGLALGVHHVTIGLTLPAMAAVVYSVSGFRFFRSRRLAYAALAAIAGLSIYAYLPISASRSPLMNWGDPRTLERLWWHVSGKQYQTFFSPSLEIILNQFSGFLKLIGREFGPWWLPAGLILAGAGFASAFRKDRPTLWFLVLIVAVNVPYALSYEIAEDKDAYYLPTFAAIAIAAGLGAQWLISSARSLRFFEVSRSLAPAALMLVPLLAFVSSLPYNNRRHYFIARDYVANLLTTVEHGGMLLTIDWQVYSPLLYTVEIEKQRTDVIAIDLNQLRRSWYFAHLERAYPGLMEKTRDKVDAFLEDLRHWEHAPADYDRDAKLNQRINTRFNDMILGFVSAQLQSAPVYITQELVAGGDGQYRDLTKAFEATYQFVPQGLVFEVARTRGFREPLEPRLVTRGLTDGSVRFENDDVVKVKVLPVYLSMLVNRGQYLAANGRHQQAIAAFTQALALDPSYAPATRLKDQSELALRKIDSTALR